MVEIALHQLPFAPWDAHAHVVLCLLTDRVAEPERATRTLRSAGVGARDEQPSACSSDSEPSEDDAMESEPAWTDAEKAALQVHGLDKAQCQLL